MTITTQFLLGGLLALGLIVTGCGTGTGGTGGAGGSAGTGGSGVPTGAQLIYEDDPLALDTVNACSTATDGIDSVVSSGIQTELGATEEATLFFLGGDDAAYSGTDVFDELTAGVNVSDAPLTMTGQFQLTGFDPDVLQLLTESACAADFTFLERVQLIPGTEANKYQVDFACPSVPYVWQNLDTGMTEGGGTLTDLSGQYDCIMISVTE